ncbi:YkgJ family cysteine cluster protein [Thermodesulfobacteriota bacterium]
MKSINLEDIEQISGKRLRGADRFTFQCRPELACFNQCCRNLNLFLYPYDVIQLKHELGISADIFLEEYVDVVMRKGNFFPDVLLRMSDEKDRACIFSDVSGCRVYQDRPYTCRTFPVEYGLQYHGGSRKPEVIGFFRPPEFCLGRQETHDWTLQTWSDDQGAAKHQQMSKQWSEVKGLFQKDPWGREGPQGRRAKMAFMASYNMEAFRTFVFESSLLKRCKVKADLLKKIQRDDVDLMLFGFDWIKLFVWGVQTKKIRLR